MIDRYTLQKMREIWSEEHKYRTWLQVELAACEAWAKLGKVSQTALKKIKSEHVSERERKHRVAKAMAPLFISDPFKRKVSGLFQTHPPLDERIKRLESM